MKKKTIMVILTIAILLLGSILIFMAQRTTYSFHTPNRKEVESISISNENKQIEIHDQKEIEDIIYVLEGNGRTTQKESVNDTPVNVDSYIKIEFKTNTKDSFGTTLYYYEVKTKYYLEQPYNGIYRISDDEYNCIAKYLQ